MKLLIKLSYCGAGYCGWQIQPNMPTVQGEICRAAKELFGYDCDVTGCSRTDSGVHALSFCATVAKKGESDLDTAIQISSIPRAFCAHLPRDISVYDAAFVPSDFHPRYDVVSKEYVYRIYTRREPSPFEIGRAYHCPLIKGDEAVELMDRAAAEFVGKYDFTSFMAQGSKITDPVRTVHSASVMRDPSDPNLILFKVSADGFLYNMVRIMSGTLVSVGKGKTSPCDVRKIIEGRDRSLAGETLSPEGLYLNEVRYGYDPFV